MHLPDEAEDGDDETGRLLERNKQKDKQEEQKLKRERAELRLFMTRDWGHDGFYQQEKERAEELATQRNRSRKPCRRRMLRKA